ncbi:hypothetical protein [Streptomyces sp. NPDC005438]|uniref:hypothetical protein n=1 Tax=Streptomyces sp. NPDC005438 TaxID=3156880 RepID=UPI0033A67FF3
MAARPDPTSEHSFQQTAEGQFDHLRVAADARCWWCRNNAATTGEHKFKRSSLTRLMGEEQLLLWGDGNSLKEVRGKSGVTRDRHGVVKFPKSMCAACNNTASQPFDDAYDVYAKYVEEHHLRHAPGIDMQTIYGEQWQDKAHDLARYHAKHFGCRMVRTGLPVPQSLRDFMDGADDMPDAHMCLISTDSVHKMRTSLSISPDFVWANKAVTRFDSYVMAAYIGAVGVRYRWHFEGIPPEFRSQFFHHPTPVLNFFKNEFDMAAEKTRKPGWLPRLRQWAVKP